MTPTPTVMHNYYHHEQKEKLLRKASNIPYISNSRGNKKINRRSILNDVDTNGKIILMDPRQTYWCRNYVQFPKVDNTSFQRKFRNRFRLPYEPFKRLLEVVSNRYYFHRWVKIRSSTTICKFLISLLLLGSLRYLGRGWTFDDLEEATGVSRESHQKFSTVL